MYYPRFTKVIIDYFMTMKPSIPRRNRVNWRYVRDGVILPIELTNDDIRNSKAYKEYYACATEPTDVERTEAEQLKIVLKRSRQETQISQQHGSGTDEGTGSRPGVPDVPSDDS
nr:hypothetical protein [Tanacetum cinerariifolium]